MPLKTKIGIASLLGIYIFSHSFTQWIFGLSAPVYAAEETAESIIAVFVDKAVYDKHTSDINRYAQTYLQKRSSATKALLLPIDKNGFKAQDIWKVLENLYLEGIKEKKSSLIGTVLIGDLPLPVIKEDDYIYPSVYPYTDLEKPTYTYSETENYFIPEENSDHKAEIRQSVISFSTSDDEYKKFFSKLRGYDSNPSSYTSTKIRYDDFIALKKYFADQFLQGYTNNFLFHEDITYHRYTNLILDYFKKASSDEATSLVTEYATNSTMSTDDDYSQLGEVGAEYTSTIGARKQNLNSMAQQANVSLDNLDEDTDKVPTLMIGEALKALIKPYTSLFSPEYLSSIQENVAAGGRWEDADIDSHIKKTILKDDLTSTVLLDANTVLEKTLYNTLDQGNYALHIPIPLIYEKYICTPAPIPPYPQKYIDGRFENFYFGKSAFDISSTQDISIYPGTWKNIGSWADIGNYNYTTQSNQDDIPLDYTQRSIGSSYGIASRQVEASRGYNTSLVPSDINFYNARKCNNSQPVEDFVTKYWGGISPLNVDGNTLQLNQNNPKMAWNPRFDITIGGPVFDIAGSKKTTVQMNSNLFFLEELNNSMLHRTQQYRIAPWLVCGNLVPPGEVNENRYNGYPHKEPTTVEYFSKFGAANVIVVNNNQSPNLQACGETFIYKTIDTLETHSSPTAEQIDKMTPLTADRPIDSARFVAFKGIGGSAVKIVYPNIYNVSVYKKEGDTLILKSVQEINESIKTYLKDKVSALNTQLSNSNAGAASYYSSKAAAFDNLGTVDTLATPKNRSYTLLPQNFFVTALGEETINAVAEILYRQNLGWAKKPASADMITDMNNTARGLDINKKISYTTESYLTKQTNPSAGKVPGYEARGYEVVYINSDGNDAIKPNVQPAIIQTIEQQKLTVGTKDTRASAVNAGLEMQESQRKEKCGISKDATVPLLKWPKALACWMQSLKDMTLKDVVKINFKNAQGPALSLDQFKDTATSRGNNVEQFSQALQTIGGSVNNVTNEIRGNDITIRLSKSSIRIDETPNTALIISSSKQKGSVNIRISGTGDNCPLIAGKNVCKGDYVTQKDISNSEISLPVTLASTAVGSSIINVKVCQGSSCTEKRILLPIIPGALTNVQIATPTDRMLFGSQLPFTVIGYDSYGNRVENGLTSYALKASAGSIISNGDTSKEIELHRFDATEEFFLDMQGVNKSTKEVTLTLEPKETITGAVLPRATKNLTLTDGTLTLKYNQQNASSIALSLPDDPAIYFTTKNDVTQLNETTIPKIVITLTDTNGKPLDSQAVVKSTNGLLSPGVSVTNSYTLSGKTINAKEFTEQSSFRIQGGVATILLYPSFRAGTDTLTIEIPGMPVRSIPITVGAASPYRTALQLPESIDAESSVDGTVQVYDKWNNRVTKPTTIQLKTIGDLLINNNPTATLTTSNEGVSTFVVSSNKVGGTNYIYSYIDKVALTSQQADTKSISTITPLRRSDNLNAMYLVLGGNDRANKWNYFSQQKNTAEKILTNSEKTLAVTTMLINPDKVLPAQGRISKNGQIYDAESSTLNITDGSLQIQLEDVATINLGKASSFTLKQGDANKTPDNYTIIYTPEQTDSEIEKNEVNAQSILINGEQVRSLDNNVSNVQIVWSKIENNMTVWQVLFNDTLIGTLRLRGDINQDAIRTEDVSGIQETWLQGSTNSERGWMIYSKDGLPLSAQTERAGGIEDSRDPDTQTAWTNTFHVLTAFAQGDKVGQATLHGASPFLITYGDPLIGRQTPGKAVSGTAYESGQGKTIFTETEKSISQTLPFDLDRDGQKDLLIVYTDGTLRILKNNGSKENYKNLGTLMMIAGGIKKIYVGDTDSNSYEDIVIQTKEDKLKVYKNDKGKIQVDGLPVCLTLPGQPDSMENAHELFVADMDKDKNLDIIANDTAGNITVFYGGSSAAGDNYISKDLNGCDADRQARTTNHMKLVKSYGVSLTAGQKVYDNSLVRRQGLVLPTEMDPNNEADVNPLASNYQNLVQGKNSDFSSLNFDEIVNSGLPELIQYSESPVSELPAYETASAETIAYMPIHMLEQSSPVTVSKQYKKIGAGGMKGGEKVQVEITIEAHQTTKLTYLDEIKGPRQIEKNDDGSIAGRTKGNLPASSTINWSVDNGYQFMIDNIPVQAGQKIVFSYSLTYQSPKLVSIELADVNTDSYKDIKTFSTDSCQKGYWSFVSKQGKDFTETYVDLSSNVEQAQKDAEDEVKTALKDIQDQIKEASESDDPKIGEMPGMDEVLEKRTTGSSLLQSASTNLTINLDSPQLKNLTKDIEKTVDSALKGMCKGFKLGKGGAQSGPPVPFNMAFLSPGTYNIFGCKLMEDKGLPAFFYPGTIYVGPYTVPFPYGLKSSTDGFYWADGGVYPSMIRIYVSPTITMGVGIAICFGSYQAAAQMPSPFKHISGNCIVLAKSKGGKKNGAGGNDNAPVNNQLTVPARQHDLAQAGTCNRPTTDSAKPVSPFFLNADNTNPTSPQAQAIPGGAKAGGLIYFDQEPAAVSISAAQQSPLGTEKLKSGKAIKLEIQGGDVKGLVKCIINKWMDNQIRYIINNLTNLSVNLYLPDVSSLFEGFDNLSLDKLDALYKDVKGQTAPSSSAKEGVSKGLVSKEGLRNLSDTVSNPFDALSSLFENVPLININTQDITIQVPFLAQEDITKYSSYLKDRIKRNEKNLNERTQLAQSAAGKCDGIKSAYEKNACEQKIQSYVDISDKSAQLVRALKQNINTLEEYRKFPTELNKWLSVSQRYLTEVSDTVSTFTNSITSRLQINARRFEQYVNAIILVISAVKTWQVLIDFSVNRKTKCGKCKVDNYDFYSCTLSLLCIDLPVLPIPPFRIPNITIDLSHINLGLDILLPKFNFVPKNIPLPTLPDLPVPPSIDVDLNLNVQIPKIPVLPAPPKLPELPSFIPSIELNLPTLPPAPRIPKIAPAITATIKVAGFIAKVFCIVKGGIGLVAEKGVKTRIEQMTQRTWNVEPFDSISITKVKAPIKGFDIRVDTYINMQINFNGIYDLLDGFADQINEKTNEVMGNVIQESIGQITEKGGQASQTLQNGVDKGNINIQGFTSPERWNLAYDDPETMRNELKTELTALKNEDTSVARRSLIDNALALVNTPTIIEVNTDGINEVHDQAQQRVSEEKANLDALQQTIENDYDNFIQSLQTTLVSNDSTDVSLSTNLLGTDKKILDTMKNEAHPDQSYLELNKKLMDGFANSLATHTPEELNMSLLTYNETKNYIGKTLEAVNEGLGSFEEKTTTNPSLLAATAGTESSATHSHAMNMPSETSQSQTDLSQYVRGIFVKDGSGDLVNVVNRDDIMDTLQNNQERIDLNNDGAEDIILRSEKHVRIKYAHPEKTPPSIVFTRLYRTPSFKTPVELAKATSRGRLSTAGSSFKISDTYVAVQGLDIQGQDFDSISVQWTAGNNDGYIVALNDTVSTKYDRLLGKAGTKYALVLASGTNIDGLFLSSDPLSQKRVSDLIGNKTIIQVSYYDPSDASVSLTLTNIPRQRQYLSVAKLSRKSLGVFKKGVLLEKASPRSRQEVAGKQFLGDRSGPIPTVRLIRTESKQIEAQGYTLYPVVGNAYTLAIEWNDDTAIQSNAMIAVNGAKQSASGSTLIVKNVTRTSAENQTFTLTALDSNNNTSTYSLVLDWQPADLTLENVSSTGNASIIDTSLSKGLDRTSMVFEKEKNPGIWSLLTGVRNTNIVSLFPVGFNQQGVTGGVFMKSSLLVLYNSQNQRIGTIDKNTLQLSLDEGSKDSIDTLVSFTSHNPVLLIKEKTTNAILFTLTLQGTSALNTTVSDTAHRKLMSITNGKCIADMKGNCEIYVHNNGVIEVSDAYKNKLQGKFTATQQNSILELYDLKGTKIAETNFIPQPIQ